MPATLANHLRRISVIGLTGAFQDASTTPAPRDQVFAVITDGLRPR